MMIEEIEKLLHLCERAGIGEIELSEAGFSLRLRMEPAPGETIAPAAKGPEAEAAFKGVGAPGVGVFRLCHPATGRPIAEPGRKVQRGETVGVLQAGPYLKAVIAPADGILGAALAEDGAVVGYGTPLYELYDGANRLFQARRAR